MRWGLLVGLCGGLLAGCATGMTTVIHPPAAPLGVSAVLIPPVRIVGAEEPGWRRFELGQRLVHVGLREAGEVVAFFGPSEFQIVRWDEPGWLGSTGVPALARAGVPVEQALVLRGSVERREASTLHEREDGKGRARGGLASQETTWVATVELIHPSSRHVLGEFSGSVTIDPFAQPTGEEEFDPAPPMTHLLERLARAALELARRWQVARPAARELGLTLALSPAITSAQPDAAAAQPDALQAEIWMQARARFLSPWLTGDQAARLARTPAGLLVVAAPGGATVLPGDLLLSIEGQPALPEVLARRRLTGAPVQVRVGRSGEERDAAVP